MSKKYDAVIIGGGHNGLTTAAMLAKSGRKVMVLERQKTLGGLAGEREFHQGYHTAGVLNDTSRISKSVIDALKLTSFGLEVTDGRPSVKYFKNPDTNVIISADRKKSAEQIAKYSPGDGEQYIKFLEMIDSVSGIFDDLVKSPLPDLDDLSNNSIFDLLKTGWKLKKLGKSGMANFISSIPMCVADWVDKYFNDDLTKSALTSEIWEGSSAGPWSPGTTFNLLLKLCASKVSIKGGPSALNNALIKAAESNGVELRTDAEVKQILIQNGSVTGVKLKNDEIISAEKIAASCDPRHTFLDLIPGKLLEHRLKHRVEAHRGTGNMARINLAVSADKLFLDQNGNELEYVRTTPEIDTIEKSFDQVKYGTIENKPLLDIHIPSVSNKNLCPSGHSVVSILVPGIPYNLKGGWTEDARKNLTNSVISELEKYSAKITNSVKAAELLAPVDLEEQYGLVKGHLLHGEPAIDQFIARPTPECARYETPIKGLYLCGSGSHPGGGITCRPGQLAAKRMQ